MSITAACSSLYMWLKQTEHFPWGLREVRPLLVARGLAGFFGVFGMYCKFSTSLVWYYDVPRATFYSVCSRSEVQSVKMYCRAS
jgi:hypothetical protein